MAALGIHTDLHGCFSLGTHLIAQSQPLRIGLLVGLDFLDRKLGILLILHAQQFGEHLGGFPELAIILPASAEKIVLPRILMHQRLFPIQYHSLDSSNL